MQICRLPLFKSHDFDVRSLVRCVANRLSRVYKADAKGCSSYASRFQILSCEYHPPHPTFSTQSPMVSFVTLAVWGIIAADQGGYCLFSSYMFF